MPKVTFLEPGGRRVDVEVPANWTLMQGATANGIAGIEAECGGACSCATCHCFIETLADRLPPPADNENEMLDFTAQERQANSRLACQVRVTEDLDGLVVRFPDTQS